MNVCKDTFEAVCGYAKIRLDYEKDFAEISDFYEKNISGIKKIEIDGDIDLLDMGLVNTFREDIPVPSLSRDETLSVTKHVKAGCVSIPVSLREVG